MNKNNSASAGFPAIPISMLKDAKQQNYNTWVSAKI